MKKFLVLALALFSLPALAAGAGFRLGVVDFQAALNGVEEGKTAKAKLKTEFEQKQKDLEVRKTSLDKLQKEIEDLQKQAQSGLLKPEVMEKGRKLEMEFRTKFEEYTKIAQTHQREISEKESKATQDIISRLRQLVIELGRDGKYTMVVERNESGLVYASEPTDLTEKLIQTFNTRYKGKK